MEYTGIIASVAQVTSGLKQDGSTWSRQDFVFEFFENYSDQWPQRVLLSVMNDRINALNLQRGEKVKVNFTLGTREWNGRVFQDVRLREISKVDENGNAIQPGQTQTTAQAAPTAPTAQAAPAAPTAQAAPAAQAAQAAPTAARPDDLPF